MLHRSILLAATALLCSHALPAQARVTAVVVRWGQVEVEGRGEPVPQGQAGSYIGDTVHVRAHHYLNWASTMPATLCRGFGVELWVAAGPGETLPDDLTLHVRHPRLTRPDGVSATEFTAPAVLFNGSAGEIFTFDEPWEAQPGEWQLDFLQANTVIASKTFTVTPVPPGDPITACRDIPQS